MACPVNFIIFPCYGQTIFDYVFYVFSVRMGVKVNCSVAMHDFSGITKGHKRYNAENYEEMLSVTRAVSPGLVIVAKTIISLGGFLMFSGLWLK